MDCTVSKAGRQAARTAAALDTALLTHRAATTACCALCAEPLVIQGEWIVCPRCRDARPNPVLCPTEAQTLDMWRCRVEALGVAITIRSALSPIAAGHPAGVSHAGYQQHVRNTAALIASGQLVQIGEWREQPTFRPAEAPHASN